MSKEMRSPILKMNEHSKQAVTKYGKRWFMEDLTPSNGTHMTNKDWLTALMEEVGEVARGIDNQHSPELIYGELADAGGVIINWMKSIREYYNILETVHVDFYRADFDAAE